MADGTQKGPAGIKFRTNDLTEYFNSIEQPFRETRHGMAESDGFISNALNAFLISSLIPVTPFVVCKILVRFFGTRVINMHYFSLRITSFWFLWVFFASLAIVSVVLLAKLQGPSAEDKKEWLSRSQMRFAYCFAARREIRKFDRNHRDAHVDAALDYLNQLNQSLHPLFTGGIYHKLYLEQDLTVVGTPSGPSIILSQKDRPRWYRLQPDTELILDAFGEFADKMHDRIKDHKDLESIDAVLTKLAGYLYTEIPELSDSKSKEAFEQLGMQELVAFAQFVKELPAYHSEAPNPTPKEKVSQKIVDFSRGVSGLFTHKNVLLCFLCWYILALFLVSLGFMFALHHFPNIKVDSTIITALVGGPVAAAVTAVTLPRLSQISGLKV
jgi:hypothetical protein